MIFLYNVISIYTYICYQSLYQLSFSAFLQLMTMYTRYNFTW